MDYFGPMVNRSARVMGAAKGGQIIASGVVWHYLQVPGKKSWEEKELEKIEDRISNA
tara:strand:+ start:146 stop:316 length:171 start_codon:yes stop_codon:yes gene_type:complete